ncbi:MAG: hypothetical protein FJ095_07370 [Deltaproteobacteria bacterium]|nr:hypothetical protein [Deltaproteobacteria bacterium]
MRIAGQTVEGAKDDWEELALLFAATVQEEARGIVTQVQELDGAMAQAQHALATSQAQYEAARAALQAKDVELEHATARSPGPFTESEKAHKAAAVICLVVGVVGGLLGIIPLLFVAVFGVIWALHTRGKRSDEKAAKDRAVAGLQWERSQLEAPLAGLHQSCEATAAAIRGLEERRRALRPQKVVKALGRAYLPFLPIELAGYTVMVDGTGATAATTLSLPDLAANGDTLARVQDTVERAKRTPILLRPTGDGPSAVDHIHGEERDLGEAIDTFGELLESVPVLSAEVPLVNADTPIMRALRAKAEAKSASGAVIRGNEEATRTNLALVQRYTDNMRGTGKNIEQTLRRIRDDLRTTLVRYGSLRAEAVEEAHRAVTEVLGHADYAHVTYYCPRCNRVPQYLFQQLGVDIETAHLANPIELLHALQENEQARQRIVADEGLLGDMSNVYQGIHELDAAITSLKASVHAQSLTMAQPDLREVQITETRLRALLSQKNQLILQYQSILRKIVTGNARPVLELSRQARLQLDPDTGEWDCPLCELHVDDQELARMGRLLKIKDELLMPMWNALWAEKDDFRKSELFRTNEQIQRLVEKETGALRDVAEQYRADMRPVRENLMLATTEAVSARDKLESAVMSLRALGVITEERASETMGRLGTQTGGNLDEHKKRAEAKETLLNQEPQATMSRRIMARDPINVLMTPDQLFRESATDAEKTSLGAKGAAP